MKLQHPIQNKSIVIALVISLALHLAVLMFKWSKPPEIPESKARQLPTQLDVRIAKAEPFSPPPRQSQLPHPVTPRRPTTQTRRKPTPIQRPIQRSSPLTAEVVKPWSKTEKDEMSRFLNDLQTETKPRTGRDLEQDALAMARTLEKHVEKDDEAAEIAQRLRDAQIEPLSIELYYEALFNKLNRSAEMVKNKSKETGLRVAVVRVVINPDGSVRSFTVQQTADQQTEIAYIKSVVERAAPFPAFPPDIRKATDAMILQICIQPQRTGPGGNAFFSRLSRGEGCR